MNFYAFCRAVLGKPVRQWATAASTVGFEMAPLPDTLGTAEQSLLKACILIYIGCEPAFLPTPAASVADLLNDAIFVDYTGTPGQLQGFIYFPPDSLQRGPLAGMQKLYDLGLLAEAVVQRDGTTTERWFTPLNLPGQLMNQFGDDPVQRGENYRLWEAIRERRQAKMRKVFHY